VTWSAFVSHPLRPLLVLPLVLLLACGGQNGNGNLDIQTGAESSGDQQSIPIAVAEQPGGSVIVTIEVAIEGQGPYAFILDTGASLSAIDRTLAQELNLPESGLTGSATGLIAETRASLVRVERWRLDGIDLSPGRLVVLDLQQQGAPVTYRGLLGSDVLSRYGSVTIDYEQSRLILRDGPASP
jgi:predicted aspartyl protease